MKAVRLHEYGLRPVIERVPEPTVSGPLDVIVRIGGAGLCRTDLHIVEGQWRDKSNVALPYTLGYENAGWVHAVGPAVENGGQPTCFRWVVRGGQARSAGHPRIRSPAAVRED